MLNTRYISASSTAASRGDDLEDRRHGPGAELDDGGHGSRQHARQVPLQPPPVMCAAIRTPGRANAACSSARYERMRREQRIGERHVAHAMVRPERIRDPTREAVAVRVQPHRRQADEDVADADARRIRHHRALDDPDHAAGQVVAAVAIRPGHLGRLAADDRDARRSARLRHPTHERA